jgi:O-succinylbenzoic acid--CoA ligase
VHPPDRSAAAARSNAPAAASVAVPLVAITLTPTQAAPAVAACWEDGSAVLVLDPKAPAADRERVIGALRPTEVWEGDGRRPVGGGLPVAEGVAAVVTTSGTTGEPRGVELSHAALAAAARAVDAALDPGPDDRWLCCLPLHGIAGLAIAVRARQGGRAVEVHDGFSVDRVGAAVAGGAGLVSLVPTMLARLLDAGAPLAAARAVLLGGGPIPAALRARAEAAGVPVIATYGLTETGGGCVHDGRPLDGVRVAIGADDEILLAGPMLFERYRLRPELTEAARVDGWLRTGDAGRLHPDGRLEVVDRIKDLVVTGGVNVSPTEVERVLTACPGVADVAVRGRPDAEWGERVVAFVVPVDPQAPPVLADVRAWARDRLAAAKLPRELVLVDTVPRSPGGKVLRRLL